MNCEEANNQSIIQFLSQLRIEPVRINGNSYWYLSPLRKEKSPSFKVDAKLNRWYDHASGMGGKLVDLGIKLTEDNVSQFLKRLEQHDLSSFSFQRPEHMKSREIEIKKVKALENKALLSYLENRGIKEGLAKQFCQEVYYQLNDKHFFAIAFTNDTKGFEIRNKYFKGCIGNKDITTIKQSDSSKVLMFEGFIDFLSSLKELSINLSTSHVIILNSVNQIEKAKLKLKELAPTTIETYFDNDEAGIACLEILRKDFPNATDRSHIYKGFKDLNEMIISKRKINKNLSL